jgi:hypothetical protein
MRGACVVGENGSDRHNPVPATEGPPGPRRRLLPRGHRAPGRFCGACHPSRRKRVRKPITDSPDSLRPLGRSLGPAQGRMSPPPRHPWRRASVNRTKAGSKSKRKKDVLGKKCGAARGTKYAEVSARATELQYSPVIPPTRQMRKKGSGSVEFLIGPCRCPSPAADPAKAGQCIGRLPHGGGRGFEVVADPRSKTTRRPPTASPPTLLGTRPTRFGASPDQRRVRGHLHGPTSRARQLKSPSSVRIFRAGG